MKRIFDLAKLRNEKGLTQTELALKLNISQTDVSNYENDTGSIPFYLLIKLAKIFDIHNLEDFFNVQQSVLPVEVEDYFKDIREERDKKLGVFYDMPNLDFTTARHLFFIERPLYQQFHKPFILIIGEFIEELQDFVSEISGDELQFPNDNILTFISSNEERPLYSDDKETLKNYPHLKDKILYFRKTNTFFDISLSKCPFYSYCIPEGTTEDYWENAYIDLFLNTEDIKNATSAIVFSDSQLLKNCNILLCSSNNTKIIEDYSSRADIILTLNNKKNVFKISLRQTEKNTDENYDFSFANNEINKKFYKAINSVLAEECSKIKKSAEENINSLLMLFEKTYNRNRKLYNFSEVDRNKIYSQTLILKSDIETLLNNAKRKNIEDFDREYSSFIEVKNIEEIFNQLGTETYKDSAEEQKTFPCNTKDLEKAKNTLFDSLSEIIYGILENGYKMFQEQFIAKCKSYNFEPFLMDKINDFLKGMNLAAEDKSSTYEAGVGIFLSSMESYYQNVNKTIDVIENKSNTDDFEKNFFEALKDIVTFSRGFTLSKARKFTKALQTFQTHNSFLNFLNEQWGDIESYYMAVMQDFFGNVPFTEIPKTKADVEQQQKELEILKKLIEELKK